MKRTGVIIAILMVLPFVASHLLSIVPEDTAQSIASLFGSLMVGLPIAAFFYLIFKTRRWIKTDLKPRVHAAARARNAKRNVA